MCKPRVGAPSAVAAALLNVALAGGQSWLPLAPGPSAGRDAPTGTITAEFPDGPQAELGADRPASDPVGSTLIITHPSDNRISWNPDDGLISVYEARVYARNDTGPNTIYFHPSFGRVVISYQYFTLPSPEDTFLGQDRVRAPGGRWGEAGSVSGVFVDGFLEVTGDNAKVHDNFVGLDWDKTTPLSNVFWPSIAVSGKHCRIYENVFCADPVDDEGGSLSVGGEDNWAYSNVIGLQEDLLTPTDGVPEVGIYVSGKGNRIGDKANMANHICARGTCIVITGEGHVVRSNAIGRNTGGQTCQYGIELKPPTEGKTTGNYIGGPSGQPGLSHNIISHFSEAGVVFHQGCDNNAMGGNLIGLKPNGRLAPPRGKTGVVIGSNTTGNAIGGSSPYYLNWIAGQTDEAILVEPGADKVQIQGCHIGFDCDWKGIHPGHGVRVVGAKGVLIGGVRQSDASDEGNLIGGCKGDAIRLEGCKGPIGIESNQVGAVRMGDVAIPNGSAAVRAIGSSNIHIGVDPPATPADARAATGSRRNLFTNCATGVSIIGPAQGGVVANSDIVGNLGDGVRVAGVAGDVTGFQIGSADPGVRPNEILTNGGWGIQLRGRRAWANRVLGNHIGVKPVSRATVELEPAGNGLGGIAITDGAHHNSIGETYDGPTNYIACNGGPGVLIGNEAHDNTLLGNWIGRQESDLTHRLIYGNTTAGVLITSGAHDNRIGAGTEGLRRNWINGTKGLGVDIAGAGTNGNRVANTYIGAMIGSVSLAEGSAIYPSGNRGHGVRIRDGAQENVIGTASTGDYGVMICASRLNGVLITGLNTNRNHIRHCAIGVCASSRMGTLSQKPWANESTGVEISKKAQNNSVGGTDQPTGTNPAFGNLISNNGGAGVLIQDEDTNLNYVGANLIGTTADGRGALPNGAEGVRIVNSSGNSVGKGTFRGANVISGNGSYGVLVQGPLAMGNLILGNLIGVDPLGNASLDPTKHNKLANGKSGVAILERANHNQVKGGNVISGNGGFGVIISGLGTDGNLVDGNVIGVNRSERGFVPNGQASLYDTGVCVRAELGQYGPADTEITNNRIYGAYRCVWLADLTFNLPIGRLDDGTRVVGNLIGFSAASVPNPRGTGIFVAECYAYLGDNEIAGREIGVQALGMHAYVGAKGCTFFDNDRHVQFAQHSTGCLGRDGAASTDWRYGHNVFGDSTSHAVDAYEAHSNQVIFAQNCNWGVYTDPGIEARIRFREGDTGRTSVVYNPALVPGPSVAVARTATIAALATQPTRAGAAITFTLSADAAVTVRIANIAGWPVKALAAGRGFAAGPNTLLWNGLSDNGTAAPNGTYLVSVEAHTATGQRTRALARLQLQR